MPTSFAALRLHPDDDVAVWVRALETGETVLDGIVVREAVPAGHKVALRDLAIGTPVRKYGQVIGATKAAGRTFPGCLPSRSEALGFGEDEIQPWRIGTVM